MKTHALNQGFEWQDHHGPYRRISDQQARQYDERGFFVVEDAFEPDIIGALIEDIDPIEARLADVMRDELGGKFFIARADEITFTTHLVLRSPVARAFTRGRFFQDLTHDLIGPNVRLYWDQSVYKKPGTRDVFPWHQDNGYTFIEPQHYLTCWVALTDADEENGCPMVAPGLHRRGTLDHRMTDLGWECIGEAESEVEAVAAPVRAGGVVVFSSLTPHLTGPNRTTDRIRKSYIVQFAPDGAVTRTVGDDGAVTRTPCNDEARQYRILEDGQPPVE